MPEYAIYELNNSQKSIKTSLIAYNLHAFIYHLENYSSVSTILNFSACF